MKKGKKISLIIISSIIGIIGISLFIYSQGGFQDKHVRKGEHLSRANKKPAISLINMEFYLGINEMRKEKHGKEPSCIFLRTEDKIYWGSVRYDFLRNNVVDLFYSDKKKYDEIMEKINHTTPQKGLDMIKSWCMDYNYIKQGYDSISVDIWDMNLEKEYDEYQIVYHGYITEWVKQTGKSYYPCEFYGYSHDGLKIDYLTR